MKHVLIKFPFLKISLFLFLLILLLSTVVADDNTSRQVDHNVGKGLSSQIQLTEQEQAWLNQRHTVRVRISEFPPHMMTLPEPRGISVDYLKLVGKRFGINFKFVVKADIPWKEAVEDLESDRKWFDLLVTMKRTPEREKKIAFTQDYLFAPWVIVNRTNSPYVSRMEDLNDRSVAVERGYVIESLVKDKYPRVKIVIVKNTLEALNSVASGITDAYVGNLTVATYFIQNGGLHNLKIAAPTPFGNHDQAMGVRSDWPELVSIINKALMAMPEAEKSEITSHWFAVKYEHGITLKKVLIWVAGPIATLSLIIVATVIWNRRLKEEVDRRVVAEKSLLEAKLKLTEALDFNETILLNSPMPIGVYSKTGQCVLANEAYAQLTGATREALLAQNFHKIISWQNSGLLNDCLTALKSIVPQQREINVVTSFGKDIWIEYKIFPTTLNGEQHLLIQFIDLTKRKRLEEELREFAFHDSLTKLPNRRLLIDRIDRAMQNSKRQKSHIAILFLDLNKFKQLNDAYGHDVGDKLLIEVANRLNQVVRESDTVARFGGDEFVVLLEGLGLASEHATKLAAKITVKIDAALRAEYAFGEIRHQGSASIGIKLFLGNEGDPDMLLKEADAAMYKAKCLT